MASAAAAAPATSGLTNLQPLSYGVISALFVVGTITIIMRIYVRGFAMRAFGWDDWAMTAMLLFTCIQQGILYFFLEYGAGLHITEVIETHPEWLAIIIKGLLAEEFWYIWMQFMIKMCFLLFYFRLSNERKFRTALYSIIGFHVATTVVIWLLYGFQCIPLAAFYDPTSYPDTKCLDTNVTYFVPYTLNMTTDLGILILPLPVIWSLQMNLRKRIAVVAVLTTGGSAVLVSGLRAIILFEFASSPDFTWSLGKMVIISNVEMQTAIIAANMPALKAFYTCWRKHSLGLGAAKGLGYNSAGSGTGHETKSSRTGRNGGGGGTRGGGTISGGDVEMSNRGRNKGGADALELAMTESEERLFEESKRSGIRVTTDYRVRSERAQSRAGSRTTLDGSASSIGK